MAIAAVVEWEVRANGNASNGGGFTNGASGTDHTQQDSAFATRTDLVIGSAGSEDELSSAADNFAADDVGNLIHLTAGSGFTLEFFEILSVAAGVATVDRNVGTADSTGGTGQLGGAVIFTAAPFNAAIAGNKLHVKADGTHSLTAAVSIENSGTTSIVIQIEGYNTSRGDAPVGTSRPLIAAAANVLKFNDYWRISNLRVTTTQSDGFTLDIGGVWLNVKVQNSSASSNRPAFQAQLGSCVNCEGISDLGNGIIITIGRSFIVSCNFHDSANGVSLAGNDDNTVVGCVFDTNTTGINMTSGSNTNTFINNIFYNNTTGIQAVTASIALILNNIFDANTTGVNVATVDNELIYLDYNVWDNTTDVTNVSKGLHAINGDPGLTDPANGDFTLGSGSNAIDAGLKVSTDVGVTGDYKWNIGVDQDDVTAGGGGGLLVHPGTSGGARG